MRTYADTPSGERRHTIWTGPGHGSSVASKTGWSACYTTCECVCTIWNVGALSRHDRAGLCVVTGQGGPVCENIVHCPCVCKHCGAAAHLCVVAIGQLADHGVHVGGARRGLDVRSRRILAAEQNVLLDRRCEERRLLAHEAHLHRGTVQLSKNTSKTAPGGQSAGAWRTRPACGSEAAAHGRLCQEDALPLQSGACQGACCTRHAVAWRSQTGHRCRRLVKSTPRGGT